MVDGDSTGTPLYSQEEANAIMEQMNLHLTGQVPADIYGPKHTDLVINMCINRLAILISYACCQEHLPMNAWNDGFLIGLLAQKLKIIDFPLRETDG